MDPGVCQGQLTRLCRIKGQMLAEITDHIIPIYWLFDVFSDGRQLFPLLMESQWEALQQVCSSCAVKAYLQCRHSAVAIIQSDLQLVRKEKAEIHKLQTFQVAVNKSAMVRPQHPRDGYFLLE